MGSKYLEITEVTPNTKKKTKDFHVHNSKNGSFLGWINWYPPFRKYAFTANGDTVFDSNCLDDISTFVKELMKEHQKNSEAAE